jgi:hypothetical protein
MHARVEPPGRSRRAWHPRNELLFEVIEPAHQVKHPAFCGGRDGLGPELSPPGDCDAIALCEEGVPSGARGTVADERDAAVIVSDRRPRLGRCGCFGSELEFVRSIHEGVAL